MKKEGGDFLGYVKMPEMHRYITESGK